MIGRMSTKELTLVMFKYPFKVYKTAYTYSVLVTKIVRVLKNYHSNWNFISHEVADNNDG